MPVEITIHHSPSHQTLAITALNRMRGDDLERAKRKFAQYTPDQMKLVWGNSNQTCQEVLDGHQRRADEIDAAIEWVQFQQR